MRLSFTAYMRPVPQGSMKAFMVRGRARLTSDNAKLKPFRTELTRCALVAVAEAGLPVTPFGKHEPVKVTLLFMFRKPDSVPKRRTHCVVKPDIDKLERATFDALTGAVWHDDAQVVAVSKSKVYGPIEGVTVTVERVGGVA